VSHLRHTRSTFLKTGTDVRRASGVRVTSTPDGSCYTSARDIPQDIFLPPSVKEEGKENQKRYTRWNAAATARIEFLWMYNIARLLCTFYRICTHLYNRSLTHSVSFAMHNKMESRGYGYLPSTVEERDSRMDSSEGINHWVRRYIFSYTARFKALTGVYTLPDRCQHIFPTLSMLHEAIVPGRSAAWLNYLSY